MDYSDLKDPNMDDVEQAITWLLDALSHAQAALNARVGSTHERASGVAARDAAKLAYDLLKAAL